MWCKSCRQDVPGLASGDSTLMCCARCGQPVGKSSAANAAAENAPRLKQAADYGLDLTPQPASAAANAASSAEFDDWVLDFELQRMRRLLQATSGAASTPDAMTAATAELSAALRNANRGQFPLAALPANYQRADDAPVATANRRRRPSPLVWMLLSLGLMAFMCGAVLLGWSWWTDRSDLWTLGMPIALGGQLGLLLGLLLQLDRLGDDSRRTSDQLDTVDQRLDDLKHRAALLATTESAPSRAFYQHLAGAANPQLLLADLKGQVDLLAMQVASR